MKITPDFLIQNLADSGLMSADEASVLCDTLSTMTGPADADTVAQELAGTSELTAYQAQCVCKGETSGLLFGDYVVLEKIGQGGMGVVLKAQHTRMERIVAVKKLTSAALESEDLVKRFYREVKASARLLHPNVVRALDAREHEGVHHLIMEYIDGQDLAEVLQERGPLPVDEAVDYIVQAGQGLEFAHQRGVFHRDIKPANLLLDHEGTVKILDMGLARIASEAKAGDADQLTNSGQVMGTCDFMAPEQAEDTSGVDHRADIYSLGCTLYRLLTNSPPYTGGNLMQLLLAHREDPIPSICDKRPDVPASVDAVFQRMVAKTPEARYQSMTEVIEALQAALGRGPAAAAAPAADPGLVDFLQQIPQEPSAASRIGRGSGKTDAAQAAATVQQQADSINDETIDYSATADTDPSTVSRQPSARAAPATRHRRPAARRKRKQAPMLVVIGAGIGISLIGAAVVAAVLYVQTDYGTVVVKTEDKDVQVLVKRGANQVYVADAKNLWCIDVKSGEYSVELKGGNDRFVLDKDTITVTRGGEVRVRVELKPHPKPPRPAIAPFDTAQAKTHQEEWAEYLGLPVERDFDLPGGKKLTMALIPPGEFLMGATEEEQARFLEEAKAANDTWLIDRIPSEGPQHRVRITRPFYLGKYEVTQAQWQSVMGSNPSNFKANSSHPVEQVSWEDIQPFLEKLNAAATLRFPSGKSTLADQRLEFALPTEAQWEYACRAGTKTFWHDGDTEESLRESGWFQANSGGKTHQVGQLKASAWGLYDMHGNVWEWCADWYGEDYYGQSPTNDPSGPPTGSHRVVRVGSWNSRAGHCRSAHRSSFSPVNRYRNLGLRLACNIQFTPGTRPVVPVVSSSKPLAERPSAEEISPETKVPGWSLVNAVPFESPAGIAYNPADDRLYAIRRGKSYGGGGLYRIDPEGTAVCVARGDRPAAVAVDPDDGDVFVSEDYNGNIFRSPFGETGRSVWVSGLNSGDADPIGMAVAPNDYRGDVIEPGEALVVDRGHSGPDNVSRFSPDEPQEKVLVHKDDGTLINVLDVTIGSHDIYLVDMGEQVPGRIYRLGAGGTLTRLELSEPINQPNGIATDPISGDLLVLDAGAGRLVRVDPDTGTVATMFTGFRGPSWAGVDVTPDGRRIFVSDPPATKIYVFETEKRPDGKLPPDTPAPTDAPTDANQAKPAEQTGAEEDAADGVRTWTETSGKTVESAFVKFEDGLVELRLPDGKIASVPWEKLSKRDQAYVAQQTQGRR